MELLVNFGAKQTMRVKNEKLSGLALVIGALNGSGDLAPIADYNGINIDIIVARENEGDVQMWSGGLDDLITCLGAQTPSYALNKKPFGETYRVLIDFEGTLHLTGRDELRVTVNASSSAFTGLDANNSGSFINVETLASPNVNSPVFIVDAHQVAVGSRKLDFSLGKNVVKVVAGLDFGATYVDSTKAKLENVVLIADDFEQMDSREVLETLNIHMFDNNPESDVNHLVIYAKQKALQNVNIKANLTQGADSQTVVLVQRMAHL